MLSSREVVEADDVVAAGKERVGQMAADEAGNAGYKVSHRRPARRTRPTPRCRANAASNPSSDG
jgi:hypothetical protein